MMSPIHTVQRCAQAFDTSGRTGGRRVRMPHLFFRTPPHPVRTEVSKCHAHMTYQGATDAL
jgi:hypothetical protein